MVPLACWSVATSRNCGNVLIFARILGAHSLSSSRLASCKREFELGPGRAAAQADILRGLHVQPGALDLLELRPQPAMICWAEAERSLRGFNVMYMLPLLPARPLPPITIAMLATPGSASTIRPSASCRPFIASKEMSWAAWRSR